MPELPSQSSGAESSVGQLDAPRGILKRESVFLFIKNKSTIVFKHFLLRQTEHVSRFIIKRKPPGPPPGRPPILSDNEDVSDDDEGSISLDNRETSLIYQSFRTTKTNNNSNNR